MSGKAGVVRIINPNSNGQVTEGMSAAVACLRQAGGPRLECVTLAAGPFGIETAADVELAEQLLLDYIGDDEEADAFVLGCYSDPGLFACREATGRPVFGIQECAALLAVSRGGRFGVVSLSSDAAERHLHHLDRLGLAQHCAGDRGTGLTVAESAGGADTFERLRECATKLRDEDGARCIILGCTGMARHREALQDALSVPVIEPTQAAASVALGAVLTGW